MVNLLSEVQASGAMQGPMAELQRARTLLRDSKITEPEAYRMLVLRFAEAEEEVESHMIQQATELGISLPSQPPASMDHGNLTYQELDSFGLESLPPPSRRDHQRQRSAAGAARIESRNSNSNGTASDSSFESKTHQRTPSVAATSTTSVQSADEKTTQKSNVSKFRKGFRRISTMRGVRRKTLGTDAEDVIVNTTSAKRPSTAHSARPALQDHTLSLENSELSKLPPHALTAPNSASSDVSQHRPMNRRSFISAPSVLRPMPSMPNVSTLHHAHLMPPRTSSPVPTPLSPLPLDAFTTHESNKYDAEALERSLDSALLSKMRTSQLQEQLRYICFRATATRLLRNQHEELKHQASLERQSAQDNLEKRHTNALASLEKRHIHAEDDLKKQIELDRQACETKLKHMQAYVKSGSVPSSPNLGGLGTDKDGMPIRRVTEADFKKLDQQFHIRDNFDALNAHRLTSFRDRQMKQIDRVIDKQEDELEKLREEYDKSSHALEARLAEEARKLEIKYSVRRQHLCRRWALAELVERGKLERSTGQSFAPLPSIEWGSGRDGEEMEQELYRLMTERKIAVDPETGVMMMQAFGKQQGEEAVEGAAEFEQALANAMGLTRNASGTLTVTDDHPHDGDDGSVISSNHSVVNGHQSPKRVSRDFSRPLSPRGQRKDPFHRTLSSVSSGVSQRASSFQSSHQHRNSTSGGGTLREDDDDGGGSGERPVNTGRQGPYDSTLSA